MATVASFTQARQCLLWNNWTPLVSCMFQTLKMHSWKVSIHRELRPDLQPCLKKQLDRLQADGLEQVVVRQICISLG
jgi:hypothetical protein